MKILLVSSGSGSRGGGEIFLEYLAQGLSERGNEVVIWIPSHERMTELAQRCALHGKVVRAKYRNTYDYAARSLATCFNWTKSHYIASEWRSLQPDVLHINKQNLEDGLDLLEAARISKIPSICTIHLTQTAKFLHARGGALRDLIASFYLRRYSGRYVTVQDARRRDLERFVAGARVATVYNGTPIPDPSQLNALRSATRAALGVRPEDIVILGVGRLVPQKSPLQFIEIAKQLLSHLPQVKAFWIGDGEMRATWEGEITRLKLTDAIVCKGWQADVRPYLAAADLLLHPALFEGLPFALVEAMACRLACAVNSDLMREIPILDESNVLVLDDVKAVASIVGDERKRRVITGAARRLAEKHFSIEKMTRSYEILYDGAVRHQKPNN